jgi:hypothetical protein
MYIEYPDLPWTALLLQFVSTPPPFSFYQPNQEQGVFREKIKTFIFD